MLFESVLSKYCKKFVLIHINLYNVTHLHNLPLSFDEFFAVFRVSTQISRIFEVPQGKKVGFRSEVEVEAKEN